MSDGTDPRPSPVPSMTDEIMAELSLPDLAERLGTDQDTARRAVESVLPTLLAGVTNEATDPQRSAALARAVREDHDPAVLEAADPVAHVDADEGDRIVQHVFGDRRDDVETRLQGATGVDSSLLARLLPMLAPLVLAWLSKKMLGAAGAGSRDTGGGGLGEVLGEVLGGAAGRSPGGADAPSGSGGGLGDVLGDVLGGGLGDVLGGALGGGSGSGSSSGTSSGGGLGGMLGEVLGGGRDDAASTPSGGGGGGLGDVLGQLGGRAGGGGGLDDLLGSILGGGRTR